MTNSNRQELMAGEDWFAIPVNGWERMAAAHQLALEQSVWEAVVAGQTLLTLRYDPLKTTPKEAHAQALAVLHHHSADMREGVKTIRQRHILPLHHDADSAPDMAHVAQAMDMTSTDLIPWLAARTFRVSLMGFQPGFAYLEDTCEQGDEAALPTIPRLATPRVSIAGGSFGFRGKFACLYAFDGPGGWPIIGRTDARLFTPDNRSAPALLSIGDHVRFSLAGAEASDTGCDDD